MVLPMRRKNIWNLGELIPEENPRALMLTGLQEILQDTFHMWESAGRSKDKVKGYLSNTCLRKALNSYKILTSGFSLNNNVKYPLILHPIFKFQKEYPLIYQKRFPTSESEAALFGDKPTIKQPMLFLRKPKFRSLRY